MSAKRHAICEPRRGPGILNPGQIDASIAWLQAHGSPAVRYLAERHLLGLNPGGATAAELWRAVEQSATAQEIFAKQRPDGSWCAGGTWARKPSYVPQGGYSPFTPKYVTTLWILMILGEMGFRVGDPRVDGACGYVMSHQSANGSFLRLAKDPGRPESITASPSTNAPCELSLYLRALGSVGMGETMKAVNQLAYFVNMASASEAILLGLKAGLELERLLEVIKASTGGSWVIEHWDYLVTIRKEYQQKRQGSTLDLVYKDIGTVLKVAKDLDEFVPLAGLVSQMDVSRWFPDNPPSP